VTLSLVDPADSAGARAGQATALSPFDRVSGVVFGLIMALTFTGSLSAAEAGREDIRAMLIGALGCNIAWGIIDGLLFLMGCLAERGQALKTLHAVRSTPDAEKGQSLIADALPPMLSSALEPAELETMRQRSGRPSASVGVVVGSGRASGLQGTSTTRERVTEGLRRRGSTAAWGAQRSWGAATGG